MWQSCQRAMMIGSRLTHLGTIKMLTANQPRYQKFQRSARCFLSRWCPRNVEWQWGWWKLLQHWLDITRISLYRRKITYQTSARPIPYAAWAYETTGKPQTEELMRMSRQLIFLERYNHRRQSPGSNGMKTKARDLAFIATTKDIRALWSRPISFMLSLRSRQDQGHIHG